MSEALQREDSTLYWHTKCRYHKAEWQDRKESQATYWRYFSPYSPRNAAENETTIGISVGRSCRWLCVSSELSLDFFGGGSSSVSFSRLQSDFPYTIFTPFRRGVVWNCMKLYSAHLCRKYAEIKNYRYLWSTIEI